MTFNDMQSSIFPGMAVSDEQLQEWDNPNHCGCITCVSEALSAKPFPANLNRPFIVCPDCGNKRCPKATLHSNECTQSNEPGQPGSIYGGIE